MRTLHKPWFTWRVDVVLADGTEVGSVTKRLRLGKARFELAGAGGVPAGEVLARNWRARDFAVHDGSGQHVAEVTKQWRGLLTEAFTDADSYAVTFTPAAVEPVRTLGFASALAVDLVMKQKDAG
ncbi:MAG: phospholipid scramblase-related protein [Actinomycetes bacterium]